MYALSTSTSYSTKTLYRVNQTVEITSGVSLRVNTALHKCHFIHHIIGACPVRLDIRNQHDHALEGGFFQFNICLARDCIF
jgi:hypothetical protein